MIVIKKVHLILDGLQIIREYPALPEELLKCQTSNYLASASADVYKALVADLRYCTCISNNEIFIIPLFLFI